MHLSPWGRVVAISALLIVGGIVALVVAGLGSRERRLVSFPVTGALQGLTFDLGEGDITVVGGGNRDALEVRRTERYAFGRSPDTAHKVQAGVVAISSRCPTSLLARCTVAYRVEVPDNVAVTIRTTGGNVALRSYRGSAKVTTTRGAIDIAGYCGNSLDARAGAGAIDLEASCAPPRMSLRSGSGDVHATLPAGRYDIDAESTSGSARTHGITARDDAPYSVQVLSASGDVVVEGRTP
jgi:putative adhesin